MKKILVADHDGSIRELLTLHLWNAGAEALAAEDAIVAGRLILESVPDLMIVEVDMPFMNGIEFVATLKADRKTRDVPVVFLGSNAEFDDLARGAGRRRVSHQAGLCRPPARNRRQAPSAKGQEINLP
jgi:CheY-like chemotaxis protein